ncbi:helix-turn-helix domain-containing protein [Algoriphagus resistens]|uniref:helix-turn-helix domain-containing protein n=1 Tax=Algoriphagus resistens TaxID=1750590 RepID=UPI0009E8ADFE
MTIAWLSVKNKAIYLASRMKLIHKSYKFRIYPTKEQASIKNLDTAYRSFFTKQNRLQYA